MSPRLKHLVADPAVGYVLRAMAWFLFFLGALRLPIVQRWVLIPFARLQGQVAALLRGEELRVLIDTSCTGSDAIAVCLGAILAFPAAWRRRLIAAAGGFALITVVNTARIGHLSGLVERRALLDLFHYRIWPALIILVAAGYAFWWMSRVGAPGETAPAGRTAGRLAGRLATIPFLALATVLVGLYYLTYDRLLASSLLASVAHAAAASAGWLMTLLGAPASVSGAVLNTPGNAWLVTPECVTTPVIPLFVAAAVTARLAWPARLALVVATPAIFFVLGVGRLMVLALPPFLVGSAGVAVHAFYQFLLAVALVVWLAARGRPAGDLRATGRSVAAALAGGAAAGLAVGIADLRALRPALERLADGVHLGHGWSDPQGALLLLPAFALGLLAAFWLARGRPGEAAGLIRAALVVAGATALLVVTAGELVRHSPLAVPVVGVRLASILLPLAAAWGMGWLGRRRSSSRPPLRRAPTPAA